MNNLKRFILFSVLFAAIFSTIISCKKETNGSGGDAVVRNIQFSLYTSADFSDDDNNISFSLVIQDLQNRILWDSALATMKIKDIPNLEHELIIQKSFSGTDQILKVGFNYSIEDVGYSWFYDTCGAGITHKEVSFDFQ